MGHERRHRSFELNMYPRPTYTAACSGGQARALASSSGAEAIRSPMLPPSLLADWQVPIAPGNPPNHAPGPPRDNGSGRGVVGRQHYFLSFRHEALEVMVDRAKIAISQSGC